MKKSCVFLFVMSILSLLPAALLVIYVIDTIHAHTLLNELNEQQGNTAGTYDYVRVQIFRYAVTIAIYLIPGIFGIIGSFKRGRFTFVCIVIGSLYALYVLFEGLFYILRGISISFLYYGLIFLLFALYTSASVIAFKSRKAE